MRLAKRKAYEQSNQFQDRYRWRAGVEATMSEYDRRTGVKQLRVRGSTAVSFCATLKALAVNIFRATAARKAAAYAEASHKKGRAGLNYLIFIIKEQLESIWNQVKSILDRYYDHYAHMSIIKS